MNNWHEADVDRIWRDEMMGHCALDPDEARAVLHAAWEQPAETALDALALAYMRLHGNEARTLQWLRERLQQQYEEQCAEATIERGLAELER